MRYSISLIFIISLIFSCNQAEDVDLVWDFVPIDTQSHLDKIIFDQDGIGHIIGGDTWLKGIHALSRDKGKSWEVDSVANKRLFDLYLTSDNSLYATGIDGNILVRREDTWKVRRKGEWAQNKGIAIGSSGEVITVAGSAFGNGVIQRFEPTLSRIQIDSFNSELVDVVFSDDNTLHVVGYGNVYRSTDAGVSWKRNESIQGDFFQAIQFLNTQVGYMVGAGGSVLKTTDAGENWIFLRKGKNWTTTDVPFRDLFFLDEQTGYVVGHGGSLFFTQDGGESWRSAKNLPKENFQSIFINEKEGFITGENGLLIRFDLF